MKRSKMKANNKKKSPDTAVKKENNLSKSLEEDAIFSAHTDEYWNTSNALEKRLFDAAFAPNNQEQADQSDFMKVNQDFQQTIGNTPELLRIYTASGITLLTEEGIRRGIPREIAMEIRRRSFVLLSESSDPSEWARISENALKSIRKEYLYHISDQQTPLVRRACHYIYLHRQENMTASDVAAFLQVDRTYLARLFREDLHTTISDYILSVKIKEAEEWLQDGKYSLSEIAANLGFCSYAYFSKRFKEYTGKTPSSYRAETTM